MLTVKVLFEGETLLYPTPGGQRVGQKNTGRMFGPRFVTLTP